MSTVMSSYVPLTERVAATLKRHAEERCHFDERHAKELHELTDSGISDDNCEAVRPVIPSLVQLLKLSGGASMAASTLLSLSLASDTARGAIREAGAIPPLVALLHAGAESKAAENAAGALAYLAFNNRTNPDAIREAGAIRVCPYGSEPGGPRARRQLHPVRRSGLSCFFAFIRVNYR